MLEVRGHLGDRLLGDTEHAPISLCSCEDIDWHKSLGRSAPCPHSAPLGKKDNQSFLLFINKNEQKHPVFATESGSGETWLKCNKYLSDTWFEPWIWTAIFPKLMVQPSWNNIYSMTVWTQVRWVFKKCTRAESGVAALALRLLAPTLWSWGRSQGPSEALSDSTAARLRTGRPGTPHTPLTQIWKSRINALSTINPIVVQIIMAVIIMMNALIVLLFIIVYENMVYSWFMSWKGLLELAECLIEFVQFICI